MEFNRKGFESFRVDVEEALKSVAKKHGVTIECGKIGYTDFDFDMNLKVIKNDGNVDGKKEKFSNECTLYGFKPDDYEREFSANGKVYKLVGFNLKSPKNCCNIYCVSDGKTYKCGKEFIQRSFMNKM